MPLFWIVGHWKTTLSADPHRALIGDDEHGWDDSGVFNFEGGCYAKTINLTEKTEPDIYRAIHTDALLENVKIKEDGIPDYFDTTKTENGRVSYPIFHIPGYVSRSELCYFVDSSDTINRIRVPHLTRFVTLTAHAANGWASQQYHFLVV